MFGLLKKKKQLPPPEPEPLKTKDIELTHIHIGQLGAALTVLADDAENLKKAEDDFVEIWTYQPYYPLGPSLLNNIEYYNVFQISRLVEVNPKALVLIESPRFTAKLLDQ